MRYVLSVCAAVASTLVTAHAFAAEGGLVADPDRVPWARFQARVLPFTATTGWRSELAPMERTGLRVASLGLVGDVYFGGSSSERDRTPRGFRATSGIIVGARQPLLGSTAVTPSAVDGGSDHATVPYLGLGYSSLVAKSGWSFSADLGVVSRSPGSAVRLGRVFSGSQSLDDVVRDMRLTPHVQLGVSYSF
ncbi:MAG TPA: hypothetical protein VHM00_07430 [Caldimonas sp.]|jgi:hypothetical protein|nr:hypothetical protein [Caldimonas sp.]HEX2540899.1 hypothetical protein [Caldimonas sp.]